MSAEVHLIWKKSCDTCRRFKGQLDAWGVAYTARELNAEPLTAADLEALIGDRPVKPFLNTHNATYRALGLKDATPDKARAVALIAETNNLLRRPVLRVGDALVIGNDLAAAAALLGRAP
ncbi:MAG: ArsC/Spx/MgsR family protein [bacterium]